MPHTDVVQLAAELVRIDSRSFISNLAVANRIEAALPGFEIERLDYVDPAGVAKRALVAHRGTTGGLAFSGHMDTVPDTGWTTDPWDGRIADGRLHGLGSTDMKGPLAACIVAAHSLAAGIPVTLLITTDEETTKAGARLIAAKSVLARRAAPAAILVAEPTVMTPVRGHRSSIAITAIATGIQAHSSTGKGRNANWDLLGFATDMKAIFEMLRDDPAWHDTDYDPPFSDFNLVIDNHGAPVNMSVPKATARVKFRYSAKIDPEPVMARVRAAASRHGLALDAVPEGPAAVTAPFGTDASELNAIAPCVIVGPGDIGQAHCPAESLDIAELHAAIPAFVRLAERVARGG